MHGHEDCFTAVVDAEEEGRPATTRGAGCAGHSGARITLPGVAALALATIMLTATLVGCGNAGAPSVAPSTIYPETSPTGTLPALKAYLDDVEQVLAQAAATATTLPDAVQGLSRTPDHTWASSAAQLKSISSQLADEAAALAALQPPPALQPVQDAVVTGIQATRKGVDELADALESGVRSAVTRRARARATAERLKAQLDGLSRQLRGAIEILRGQ